MFDLAVVVLVVGGALLGFMLGRGTAPLEYVYVQDDGEGGVKPAPRFDPDKPQPGDSLYPPEDWLSIETITH